MRDKNNQQNNQRRSTSISREMISHKTKNSTSGVFFKTSSPMGHFSYKVRTIKLKAMTHFDRNRARYLLFRRKNIEYKAEKVFQRRKDDGINHKEKTKLKSTNIPTSSRSRGRGRIEIPTNRITSAINEIEHELRTTRCKTVRMNWYPFTS